MATTVNNTLSAKQVNNGIKAILAKTGSINQVLKQFWGIYGEKLPETDGLTVETWLAAMGAVRPVNASGTKKNIGVSELVAAWHPSMVQDGTQMCIFRSVGAWYKDAKGDLHRVYTLSEGKKLDGKPFSMYKLCTTDSKRWSVSLILRGLKQKTEFAKHTKKESDAYATLVSEDFCYVTIETAEDGTQMRKVLPISADDLYFKA